MTDGVVWLTKALNELDDLHDPIVVARIYRQAQEELEAWKRRRLRQLASKTFTHPKNV